MSNYNYIKYLTKNMHLNLYSPLQIIGNYHSIPIVDIYNNKKAFLGMFNLYDFEYNKYGFFVCNVSFSKIIKVILEEAIDCGDYGKFNNNGKVISSNKKESDIILQESGISGDIVDAIRIF